MSLERPVVQVLNTNPINHLAPLDLRRRQKFAGARVPTSSQNGMVFLESYGRGKLVPDQLFTPPVVQTENGEKIVEVPMNRVVIRELSDGVTLATDYLVSCTGISLHLHNRFAFQGDAVALGHLASYFPALRLHELLKHIGKRYIIDDIAVSTRTEQIANIQRVLRWEQVRGRSQARTPIAIDIRENTVGGMVVSNTGGYFLRGKYIPKEKDISEISKDRWEYSEHGTWSWTKVTK